jgi:hypothetical protein
MSTVKVSRTMTRHYGAYSQSWSIEVEESVSSRADLIAAYARLDEHLIASILDFEKQTIRSLPGRMGFQGKPTQSIDQDQKGEGRPETEWVKAIGMIKEHKKGKDYFYVKTAPGTKWSKHGVSCYLDNFEGMTQQEYDKRKDQAGEIVFPEDFYVCVVKQAGKPDRAIALRHKDMIEDKR